MKKNKVAVNGYGVIGKRVADAVHVPEEMELSGVCDVVNRQVQERFPVIPIKKVTYD